MCNESDKCTKTDHPEQCTPEQIKKCHGDSGAHSCEESHECENKE